MRRRVAGLLLLSAVAACGASNSESPGLDVGPEDAAADQPRLPWPNTPFPVPPDTNARAVVVAERAELGRLLFYDPVLSVDRKTACATCHSEIWGMGDGLPRSIGHGSGLLSGPGRRGGTTLRRNAPQLWNLAFRRTLFWDGRSPSLEHQALEPLRALDELSRAPEEVVAELSALEGYVVRFAAAFPAAPAPSVDNLAAALATFERGLVSARALYDGYAAGDAYALSDPMQRGMFRFAERGCATCHVPPLFESEMFFDRHVPHDADLADEGRYEVTSNTADRRAYRVPSLRNVAFSEPYFHDGSVATLEAAITHELSQTGEPFDATDVQLIQRFLSDALKDESHEPNRPDDVPSGLPVPVDGTSVVRF